MSELLAPGEYWDGVSVVKNPLFDLAVKAPKPTREEEFFTRAVAAAEAAWNQGHAISPQTLRMQDPALPARLLGPVLELELFQQALAERGIQATINGLTPQQLSTLNMYFSVELPTGTSHAERLRAAGTTVQQWKGWMRSPRFAERVQQLSEHGMRDALPIAMQRLAEKADQGERWAVEMVLEVTGRHDRREKSVDLRDVLQKIFTILDEEVSDPAILDRIAQAVRRIVSGGEALQIAPVVVASVEPTEGGPQ